MTGWNFPKIFNGNAVDVIEDAESATVDLQLLINSEIFEFRYDPAYGSNVPMLLFKPKSPLTRDLIVSACYELQNFCPNIRFKRDQVVVKYTTPGEAKIYIPVLIDNQTYTMDVILYAEAKS